MRACGRCGHDNADHLAYCCGCGRRMESRSAVRPTSPPSNGPASVGSSVRSAIGSPLAGPAAATAFAATVALSNPRRESLAARNGVAPAGIVTRGFGALRYVFVYVRGRIDAEDRRRTLTDERDGARRLIEAALVELGRIVLHQAPQTSELAAPIAAVARAQARREAAIADLAAAEKLQAAEDLRLGAEQAAAETEWRACDAGAAQVDKRLGQLEDARREVEAEIRRLSDDPRNSDGNRGNGLRPALTEKRARLDEEYGHLRERAAALRASTGAARTKLDQAIAARRQATAALSAGLLGHARTRSDAEKEIATLTLQIGRLATDLRIPLPAAHPGYARVDRLEQTIADRDRQIGGVERTIGGYDRRKLGTGLGLLTAILGVLGASLWALLR